MLLFISIISAVVGWMLHYMKYFMTTSSFLFCLAFNFSIFFTQTSIQNRPRTQVSLRFPGKRDLDIKNAFCIKMCYFWIIYILILLFPLKFIQLWKTENELVNCMLISWWTKVAVNIFSIQVNPQEAGQQRRNHNLMYNHCSLNITRMLLKTKARPWNTSCCLDCFIMHKRSLPSLLHTAAYDIWIDYTKLKASLVYFLSRDQTENSFLTFNPLIKGQIEWVKQNQNKGI